MLFLVGNQNNSKFSKVQSELLSILDPSVDIFLFGALILYIVNNGKNWTDSTQLQPGNVKDLVLGLDFFEDDVY